MPGTVACEPCCRPCDLSMCCPCRPKVPSTLSPWTATSLRGPSGQAPPWCGKGGRGGSNAATAVPTVRWWRQAAAHPFYSPVPNKPAAPGQLVCVQELKVFDHLATAFNLNREDVTWEQVRCLA